MAFLARAGRSAQRLAPGARALYQTEQLRHFAEPANTAQEDDIVLSTFRKQQQQYQALMKGLEGINIPLTGDDAAVKKYAAEVESLKKKIGMPDIEEVIEAELEYQFACSGYDIRKFLNLATEGMDLGNMSDVVNELMVAVDEAEAASGRDLDSDNDKGWQLLTAKVGEIERKYNLQDKAKVRDDAIFDMYKSHIDSLRTQVSDDVDKVRKAEHLDDVQLDLSKLSFKLP